MSELRNKLIECSIKLSNFAIPSGPDWSGYFVEGNIGIAHERLAIIDPETGAQPFKSKDEKMWSLQTEKSTTTKNCTAYIPLTGSDCEVAIPLYLQVRTFTFGFFCCLFFLLFYLFCFYTFHVLTYLPMVVWCGRFCEVLHAWMHCVKLFIIWKLMILQLLEHQHQCFS